MSITHGQIKTGPKKEKKEKRKKILTGKRHVGASKDTMLYLLYLYNSTCFTLYKISRSGAPEACFLA